MKTSLPPRCAAKFRIERLLGTGGFSEVFLAIQQGLDRPVALKLLRSGSPVEGALERFELEARLTASLNHSHIVKIVDHQVEGDLAWIAYELLEGPTLREVLTAGPLSQAMALEAAAGIAAALQAAHEAGILHRDVKPENVIKDTSGAFKVTDFGIAKAVGGVRTEAGVVLGTPQYIAPELLRGEPPSPRSDIYSFGVMLHEMVTGVPPFPAEDISLMLQRKLREDPPSPAVMRPGMSPRLERLILSCMARIPGDRPVSMGEIVERLESLPREESGQVRVATQRLDAREKSPEATRRIRADLPPSGRSRVGLTVICVTLIALTGAIIHRMSAPPPLHPATLGLERESATIARERGLTEAVAAYRELIALEPRHAPAHAALADCLDRLGQGDAAVEAYRASLALDPSPLEVRSRLAVVLVSVKKRGQARALLVETIRRYPDSGWAQVQLACVENVDPATRERAMRRLEEVARRGLDGGNVAHAMLGTHAVERGEKEEAAEHFRASLAAPAGPADSWRYSVLHLAGSNRGSEAKDHFDRLIQLDPLPSRATYDLGALAEGAVGHLEARID